MNEQKPQNQNFIVTRDGELDPDYHPQGINLARVAVQEAAGNVFEQVRGYVGQVAANVALEARMYVFDKIHDTNYRGIRHQLLEEKRKRQFEATIGLERK